MTEGKTEVFRNLRYFLIKKKKKEEMVHRILSYSFAKGELLASLSSSHILSIMDYAFVNVIPLLF